MTIRQEPTPEPKAITDAASRLLAARRSSPSDQVEAFFQTPVPKVLWHYTSLPGFEGIVSSHRIWATEARFTTDETEFVHARDVALKFLRDLAPASAEDRLAKKLAISVINEEFENGALSQAGIEVFIASFSSAENLKSQWNEYSDGGRGVSIGFDLTSVRPPSELEFAITLAPCVYETDEKEDLIRSALQHFMSTTSELHVHTGDRAWVATKIKEWQLVNRIFGKAFNKAEFQQNLERDLALEMRSALALAKFDLLRLASHCKNPYFAEEKEWRLALPHTKGKSLAHIAVEYRGLNGNIPFVAHDLFQPDKLPISHVLLGPRCDAGTEIRELLHKCGYDVPVDQATSPTRRPEDI